jgi:hypothetical protein
MEIQIIQTSSTEDEYYSVKNFGILLNKIVSEIKMIHWFVTSHNAHVILGNLYDDLSDLFDELQEEIIGSVRLQGGKFPVFQADINIKPWDECEFYENDDNSLLKSFFALSYSLKSLLTSMEFKSYLSNIDSGLNNTVESIITRTNKAEYLLSMVKI